MTCFRSFYSALTLSTLLLAVPALGNQNIRAIETAVADHLEEHYRGTAKKMAVRVSNLDPRLKLANCGKDLQMNVRDQSGNGGAVSVHVQCVSPSPWAIYVSAQVDLFREIVVATGAIRRGERLHESNIGMDLANTSLLRQGFMLDSQRAIGQVARRNLQPGEALRQSLLEAPIAVSRGETVSLESQAGSILVATRAEALSDGRVGEQIRVRNISSERVINANVVGEGRVEASY